MIFNAGLLPEIDCIGTFTLVKDLNTYTYKYFIALKPGFQNEGVSDP